MNIQTLLLTTLALVGCDTEKETIGEHTGGNCGGEYLFDDDLNFIAMSQNGGNATILGGVRGSFVVAAGLTPKD